MGVSLGILAGMGPRSTAPFIDMLVTDCQVVCGAKYDMDFPEMHIISLPTPFWPGKKINCSEMIAALQHGIAELVKADVSLIAVPCNLAHCYFDEMNEVREGANKQVISSQADSLIKISRIWADFFPANTSNQPI
ncbi:Uncharacterised protein [Klebsiella pneumoniae]|uniref:Aspartate racemase n=1 Tax=Klebsiella pneumoniae TaxID=573 RepID=A0A486DKL2_KLEPN|nr:hypothetical protein [Klebsiella pneumoniae]VGH46765.1 Uncharacterised protein [Klebsiella pneumoniae]VGI79263.1 Uncharacterised protein [Klebsiella pneumoniae]VGJ94549.1 Uncharacterised protein [Klebsiella pneumoniae]VGK28017.1 Uncharacterised protein [Klebsiella pneumoniae]VGK85134.1 Uncharacterised protein [Klebsiella pneumoniae]